MDKIRKKASMCNLMKKFLTYFNNNTLILSSDGKFCGMQFYNKITFTVRSKRKKWHIIQRKKDMTMW